jgi:hypothetical protein
MGRTIHMLLMALVLSIKQNSASMVRASSK